MRPQRAAHCGCILAPLILVTGAFCPVGAQPNNDKNPIAVSIVAPVPLPVTGSVNVSSQSPLKVENASSNPLLVQATDEPGRQPHSVWGEFNGAGSCSFNCENYAVFGWTILLDVSVPVPAGKNWVITHISGRLPTAGELAHVALQNQRIISLQDVKTAYFGPFYPARLASGATVMQQFSGQTFAVIGPGEKAHVNVLAQEPNNYVGFVALSGYLVDAAPSLGEASILTQSKPTGSAPVVLPGSAPGPRVEQLR